MKVAVCEMTSNDDVGANIKQFHNLLESAVRQGAQFISFPENALFLRINFSSKSHSFSPEDDVFSEISHLCKKHEVTVHIGSVGLLKDNRVFNSTVIIDQQGEIIFPYDKMHLFDISLPNVSVNESDEYEPGKKPFVYEWGIDGEIVKVGLSICYDLRFSNLFQYYAEKEVDIILVPAAFLVETGKAHWEVLLRARAIETQSYVLAAAQSGQHQSILGSFKRESFGNSLIIDPWGEVLECITEGNISKIITSEISTKKIRRIREEMPMLRHRRDI